MPFQNFGLVFHFRNHSPATSHQPPAELRWQPCSCKCLRGQHRAADQPDLQKLEKPHWHIDMDQPDFGAKRAAKLC